MYIKFEEIQLIRKKQLKGKKHCRADPIISPEKLLLKLQSVVNKFLAKLKGKKHLRAGLT